MSDLLITTWPTRDEVLMTPAEVAKRWSMQASSLSVMRAQGRGPRYRKFPSGAIRYPEWAVFDYEMRKDAA